MSASEIVASVTSSVILSTAGAGLMLRFAGGTLKERWLRQVEARYGVELENLKARLDRGSYVTKAQYDLELGSFRELWTCMASLRVQVRALLSPMQIRMVDVGGSTRQGAISESLIRNFFEAHRAAIKEIENAAPFYPDHIKQLARIISENAVSIVNYLGDFSRPREDASWYEGLEHYCERLIHQVNELEELIRDRLNSLRVMA